MDAKWHSLTAATTNRTCFSHKKHGMTVYQKKEPLGCWYEFHKSGLQKEDDGNLVHEDLVSAELEKLKSTIPAIPET
jgi:hypothetical protein